MQEQTAQELRERLELIEAMIAEGRRRTESWGWTFLLWGVAYYVAMAWSTWGERFAVVKNVNVAWPVTMVAAVFATITLGASRGHGHPDTAISRAIAALWIGAGVSMMLIFPSLAMSGRLDKHGFVALVAAFLGTANGASGIILRWKMQLGCAVVWWITAALACFVSDTQLAILFLAAIFVCQIVFGVYAMRLQSHRRGGGMHA